MNVSEKRVLVPLLTRIFNGDKITSRQRNAAEWLLHRLRKPAPKSKKAARVRKEGKAATHREETGRIREAVFQRAAGRCECGCGREFDSLPTRQPQLDHWLGGSGRRREKQSVETTWMLTGWCHERRTKHIPSAASWNASFKMHCERYGYPFQAHIEHQEIP